LQVTGQVASVHPNTYNIQDLESVTLLYLLDSFLMSKYMAPTPDRQISLNQEAMTALEKRLYMRPDKQELVERNILKDESLAPSLVAAAEKLKRSQLEDKLGHSIQQRPRPEELIKEGILREDDAPGM
jgi:hypothetical protein